MRVFSPVLFMAVAAYVAGTMFNMPQHPIDVQLSIYSHNNPDWERQKQLFVLNRQVQTLPGEDYLLKLNALEQSTGLIKTFTPSDIERLQQVVNYFTKEQATLQPDLVKRRIGIMTEIIARNKQNHVSKPIEQSRRLNLSKTADSFIINIESNTNDNNQNGKQKFYNLANYIPEDSLRARIRYPNCRIMSSMQPEVDSHSHLTYTTLEPKRVIPVTYPSHRVSPYEIPKNNNIMTTSHFKQPTSNNNLNAQLTNDTIKQMPMATPATKATNKFRNFDQFITKSLSEVQSTSGLSPEAVREIMQICSSESTDASRYYIDLIKKVDDARKDFNDHLLNGKHNRLATPSLEEQLNKLTLDVSNAFSNFSKNLASELECLKKANNSSY